MDLVRAAHPQENRVGLTLAPCRIALGRWADVSALPSNSRGDPTAH
jgi:hypothetical protein